MLTTEDPNIPDGTIARAATKLAHEGKGFFVPEGAKLKVMRHWNENDMRLNNDSWAAGKDGYLYWVEHLRSGLQFLIKSSQFKVQR